MCAEEKEKIEELTKFHHHVVEAVGDLRGSLQKDVSMLEKLTDFYYQVSTAIGDVKRLAMDNREYKKIANVTHCPICKIGITIFEESRWINKSKGRMTETYLGFGTGFLTRESVEKGIKLLTSLLDQLPDPKAKYLRDPRNGTWKKWT